MKRALFICSLVAVMAAPSLAGVLAINGGSTDNVADWNGATNTLEAGRWSYLYRDATNTGTDLKTLAYQYTGGGGNFESDKNWCYTLGGAAYSYSSSLQQNGSIRLGSSGTRNLAYAYRFDAADAADGKFSMTAKFDGAPFWVGSQLAVFLISSSNIDQTAGTVDFGSIDTSTGSWTLSSGVTKLYDSTYKAYSSNAGLPNYAGNDILVSSGDMVVIMDVRNSDYTADWPTFAAITANVPEPTTMLLSGTIGLVMLRHKK